MKRIKEAQKILEYRNTVNEADYKVGETVADETYSECYDLIGENLLFIFQNCETEKEYELANSVLEAICGEKIEKILEIVHERDKNNYEWSLIGADNG